MIKVYVIAPDKSSGMAFCNVLKSKKIMAEFNYHEISPRVIENTITKSKEVAEDLNKIFKSFSDKTKSVVIACNTLQLWLNDVDEEYKRNVKVYTTFEACKWKFKNFKVKPTWLGTTPLVKVTTEFPTLISYGRPEVQDLVQELIWRIKMYEGDEYGTAPEVVKSDAGNRKIQKIKINNLKTTILKNLKELKIKNLITGCTELPMIFDKKAVDGINFIDPADVLAEYIKSQSVAIIFAGGTISSLANKDGTREGGKMFDLLEKLNENSPGTYRSLNVTKSKVVYSGLSENLKLSDHIRILKEVRKVMSWGVSRIVITHGTDAMEQTARFLENELKDEVKKANVTVALTGSNHSIDNVNTDAWSNLRLAISGSNGYETSGVFVAFNDKFVRASEVVKNYHTKGDMSYSSVKSLEYKTSVKEFNKTISKLNKSLDKLIGNKKETSSVMQYDVNVIRKDHNKLLAEVSKKKPRSVVFKLYHSGTANTIDYKSSVARLVNKLTKMGINCFGVTETGEPTDLHLYETSVQLLKSGLVPLYNMYLPVAINKLHLLSTKANKLDRATVINKMLTNYGGEIDESLIKWKDIEMLQKMD